MKIRNILTVLLVLSCFLFVTCLPSVAADDTIYSCVNKKGKVRIVGSIDQCKKKETPLIWRTTGSQGPPGPPGPQGEAGPAPDMSSYYTKEEVDDLIESIRALLSIIFAQVSAGGHHTCGIKSDNTVACWGDNGNGQSTPPPGTFAQVSAGGHHTCGIESDNTVACWGYNGSGQSTPPLGTFAQVSAGDYHTCGIKSGNTVTCWGYNGSGQSTPPTP